MSSATRTALFWLAVVAAGLLLIYGLRAVLAPFLVALALAYLFQPLVSRLAGLGLSRAAAACLVLLGVVLAVAALLVMLWPLLQAQIARLVETVPQYWRQLRQDVLPGLIDRLDARLPADLSSLASELRNYSGEAAGWLARALGDLAGGGLALVHLLTLLVITPIVTFFLLRDWPRLIRVLAGLVPPRHMATVRALAGEIDQRLAGFVRGQALICLCLAVFYTVGLMLIGLEFALTVGLISGVISFIPFVGTIAGVLLATLLAVAQFAGWWPPLLVLGLFGLGNVLEGNFLQPTLLGERVGLHPVWVIFALLAGGSLAGLTGMLVAVPAMAAIAVLVRFAVGRYRASPFYSDAPARGDSAGSPGEAGQ